MHKGWRIKCWGDPEQLSGTAGELEQDFRGSVCSARAAAWRVYTFTRKPLWLLYCKSNLKQNVTPDKTHKGILHCWETTLPQQYPSSNFCSGLHPVIVLTESAGASALLLWGLVELTATLLRDRRRRSLEPRQEVHGCLSLDRRSTAVCKLGTGWSWCHLG